MDDALTKLDREVSAARDAIMRAVESQPQRAFRPRSLARASGARMAIASIALNGLYERGELVLGSDLYVRLPGNPDAEPEGDSVPVYLNLEEVQTIIAFVMGGHFTDEHLNSFLSKMNDASKALGGPDYA